MRFWREIVGDRWSGGVLCAFLMLAVVFQVALAGRAAAAMATAEPAHVICTAAADGPHHRPAEPDPGHECPCAELCRAGLHVPVSLPPVDAAGVPIRFAERVERSVDHSAPRVSRPFAPQPPARGPPPASIRS